MLDMIIKTLKNIHHANHRKFKYSAQILWALPEMKPGKTVLSNQRGGQDPQNIQWINIFWKVQFTNSFD